MGRYQWGRIVLQGQASQVWCWRSKFSSIPQAKRINQSVKLNVLLTLHCYTRKTALKFVFCTVVVEWISNYGTYCWSLKSFFIFHIDYPFAGMKLQVSNLRRDLVAIFYFWFLCLRGYTLGILSSSFLFWLSSIRSTSFVQLTQQRLLNVCLYLYSNTAVLKCETIH